MGLPGPGVDGLIKQLSHHALIKTKAPIGFSLGGHCMSDYQAVFDRVHQNEASLFDQLYYEINISCPNTSTGRSLHDQMADIESLLIYMRKKTSKVIVIKVSPDAEDDNLCDIASIAQGFTEVTLNAGNTQFKQCEALGLPKSAISIGGGGFSGPLLFKRTLAMAKLLSQFKLPLIATGGVSTIHDIQALQEHNVVVVGMATQLVKNPYQIIRLNQQLASR